MINYTKYIIASAIVLFMIVGFFVISGQRDSTIRSYNEYKSKVADIENVHSTTLKVIQGMVGVDKITREDYDKYLRASVEGREVYGNPQVLLSLEPLQQLDQTTRLKVMGAVETGNLRIQDANKVANFAATAHNNHVLATNMIFAKPFIEDPYDQPVPIVNITSSRSKQALETGVDDVDQVQY